MKNIKLILIVLLLIVANLYLLVNISFEIKYKALIENYNELSVKYEELEEKYIAQEERLEEVMAELSGEEETMVTKLYKGLNLDLKHIKSIFSKFDLGMDGIMEAIDSYIFK